MEQSSKIIIKKYSNRRLYNTATSTYIKLEDVVNMVRSNESFIVEDAKTKEDITRLTLAQIILDYESKGYELMPESVIRLIIQLYGHPMNVMFQESLAQSAKVVTGLLGTALESQSNYDWATAINKIAERNMEMIKQMFFGKK